MENRKKGRRKGEGGMGASEEEAAALALEVTAEAAVVASVEADDPNSIDFNCCPFFSFALCFFSFAPNPSFNTLLVLTVLAWGTSPLQGNFRRERSYQLRSWERKVGMEAGRKA